MKRWQLVGALGGLLLSLLVSAGSALETRRTWQLGPQEEQSYEQPAGGRARDILDNRFEGRRPVRDERSYEQAPPLGPDGEIMDEAERRQWEKEQRIRGFRRQPLEEYGSEPALNEEEAEEPDQETAPPIPDADDGAWQEELQRRNPLPPGVRPQN